MAQSWHRSWALISIRRLSRLSFPLYVVMGYLEASWTIEDTVSINRYNCKKSPSIPNCTTPKSLVFIPFFLKPQVDPVVGRLQYGSTKLPNFYHVNHGLRLYVPGASTLSCETGYHRSTSSRLTSRPCDHTPLSNSCLGVLVRTIPTCPVRLCLSVAGMSTLFLSQGSWPTLPTTCPISLRLWYN